MKNYHVLLDYSKGSIALYCFLYYFLYFRALCTPSTELAEMWDVVFGEQAQTVLSRLSNGKDSPIREFDIPQALQLIQVARPEK